MTFEGNPEKPTKPKKSALKIILLVGVVVALIIFGVFKFVDKLNSFMRGTYTYVESVRLLSENKAAMDILGRPIEVGKIISGNVQLNNDDGTATFAIAVKGSSCEGIYHVRSDKTMGTWDIYLLVLQSDCAATPLVLRNTRNIPPHRESATDT